MRWARWSSTHSHCRACDNIVCKMIVQTMLSCVNSNMILRLMRGFVGSTSAWCCSSFTLNIFDSPFSNIYKVDFTACPYFIASKLFRNVLGTMHWAFLPCQWDHWDIENWNSHRMIWAFVAWGIETWRMPWAFVAWGIERTRWAFVVWWIKRLGMSKLEGYMTHILVKYLSIQLLAQCPSRRRGNKYPA
jgi:hypothetical protein